MNKLWLVEMSNAKIEGQVENLQLHVEDFDHKEPNNFFSQN